MAMSSRYPVLARLASPAGVALGYLLAILAGWAASAAHDAYLRSQPYDTSGGMFAAGVAITGLGVFLIAAILPTLLGLWLLRRRPALWTILAAGGVGFACLGLFAILARVVVPGTPQNLPMVALDLFGLAQLLGAPIWVGGFALFALIAPTVNARRLLVVAIGLELVIGVLAAIHWLVPSSPI